jgi:hypothetical protein
MRNPLFPLSVLVGLTACSLGPAYADPPSGPPVVQGVPPRRPVPVVVPRMELVDDASQMFPTFAQKGRRFVLGETGARYLIRIVNPTPVRVEAVVSVDGLDAIDGRPANLSKRGYLIAPYGEVTIDGWRTSLDAVAAFRFSSVRDSYAGRTGHERNVGVVGVAFFRERPQPVWQPPPNARRAAPSPPAASPADGAGAASKGASEPQAAQAESRPGLGTQFGEAHQSYVEEVTFVRADAAPMAVAELRYDDRDGLVARGIDVFPRDPREAETERRDRAEPFPGVRFAQPPP